MPWLLPLALGGLFVAGVWAIFGRSSGAPTSLVTRRDNPLLPPPAQNPRPLLPVRPMQPARPAAPGVIPGMQQATQDAEQAHGQIVEESHALPAVTSEPIDATAPPTSNVPGLVVEPGPQRPRVPPSITRERGVQAAVARSANPEVVEEHADGALRALQSRSTSAAARAAFVRRFQDAYGQGLASDGIYGPRTRQALAQILGRPLRDMPPVQRG